MMRSGMDSFVGLEYGDSGGRQQQLGHSASWSAGSNTDFGANDSCEFPGQCAPLRPHFL